MPEEVSIEEFQRLMDEWDNGGRELFIKEVKKFEKKKRKDLTESKYAV